MFFSPLQKTISNAPASGVSGVFNFTLNCGTDGIFNTAVSLTNAISGEVTLTHLPAAASCTLSEQANRPSAPENYEWDSLPAPQSITLDVNNRVTVQNTLKRKTLSLPLTKIIQGAPQGGITGRFNFNADCGLEGAFTTSIHLANATSANGAIAGIPSGASCTISEQSPLPTPPSGYSWDPVPAAQVVTVSSNVPTVTFINSLKKIPVVDPPAITKLGTISNLATREVTWTILVTNNAPNNALLPPQEMKMSDPVPNPSTFVQGSLICEASDAAVIIPADGCEFDNPTQPTQVLLKATLPFGSSVKATVRTTVAVGAVSIRNTATAYFSASSNSSVSANALVQLGRPIEQIPINDFKQLCLLIGLILVLGLHELRRRVKFRPSA